MTARSVARAAAPLVVWALGLSAAAGAPQAAAPYQDSGRAQCPNGTNCIVRFDPPPGRGTLEIEHLGCYLKARLAGVTFVIETVSNGKLVSTAVELTPFAVRFDADGENGFQNGDARLTFYVKAGDRFDIKATPDRGVAIERMECSISGDLR